MPHLTVEYSANLEGRTDLDALCAALLETVLETGLFEVGAVRVRAGGNVSSLTVSTFSAASVVHRSASCTFGSMTNREPRSPPWRLALNTDGSAVVRVTSTSGRWSTAPGVSVICSIAAAPHQADAPAGRVDAVRARDWVRNARVWPT